VSHVVEVTRGGVVESRHIVHVAVAHADRGLIASCGNAQHVSFVRSAIKMFQALPLAEDGVVYGLSLTAEEVALCTASHNAEPFHVAAVRSILTKAGVTEDALACGPHPPMYAAAAEALEHTGVKPGRIHNNCSGKHAGMLALCRARGWESPGYRLAGHPVQQACAAEIAGAAEVSEDDLPTAVDGCGVVTFALALEQMALLFARLEERPGGAEVAAAMRAHPELIRGAGAPDTLLMQGLGEWTAKGGAEGLLCGCGPGGVGLALKVADGAGRAVGPALGELMRRLGLEAPGLGVVALENSRGERVGEVVSEVL